MAAYGSPGMDKVMQVVVLCFWVPVLFTLIAPWLSLAIVTYWKNPIFAGFFNALASTGWLVASVLVFLVAAYQFAVVGPKQKKRDKEWQASMADQDAKYKAKQNETIIEAQK